MNGDSVAGEIRLWNYREYSDSLNVQFGSTTYSLYSLYSTAEYNHNNNGAYYGYACLASDACLTFTNSEASTSNLETLTTTGDTSKDMLASGNK